MGKTLGSATMFPASFGCGFAYFAFGIFKFDATLFDVTK